MTVVCFDAIAAAWDALHARAPAASFANTRWWQEAWWRAYGEGRELRIVVAERAGAVAGILPLYLERAQPGVPAIVARLVGTGGDTYPDDLGPVVEDEEAARLLAQEVARLGAHVVALEDMDPRSRFAEALLATAPPAGWRATRERAQRIPFIELPSTWEAYLDSVSASRRAGIRKVRRNLVADAAVRFFVWEDPAGLDGAFERLAWLHHRRWDAAGEPSASLRSASYLACHREVMRAALARGALRLYCLERDAEIVAMLYAIRFRDAVYLVQAGFDPAHARRRVGKALLEWAIEHAIGEGCRVLDFLRGEHPYKDHLATAWRETVRVTLLRPGLPASAWRLREQALPRWKRRMRALLEPA